MIYFALIAPVTICLFTRVFRPIEGLRRGLTIFLFSTDLLTCLPKFESGQPANKLAVDY